MEENIIIDSVADFITKLKENQPDKGYVRYYRGQNVDKPMMPSVFRDGKYELNEDRMFYDIINKKPEEFANCRCAFDHLVKMQHYGIPTRLLDITSNPLVALFFACIRDRNESENRINKKQNPIIYYIDLPEIFIKNYDSDSVTVLSNMSKLNFGSKKHIIDKSIFIDTKKEELINLIDEKKIDINNINDRELEKIAKKNDNLKGYTIDRRTDFMVNIMKELADCIKRYQNNYLTEHREKCYAAIRSYELLDQIKKDKPYFENRVRNRTFLNIFAINPRLDNPRIIRQSGAFLLFPHKDVKWENIGKEKWYINKDKVDDILEELETLNINKESLFNDMDTVCNSIREKYKTKEDDKS